MSLAKKHRTEHVEAPADGCHYCKDWQPVVVAPVVEPKLPVNRKILRATMTREDKEWLKAERKATWRSIAIAKDKKWRERKIAQLVKENPDNIK